VNTKPKRRIHWLGQLALDRGIPHAHRLELEPGVTTAEAWERTCVTCDLAPEALVEHVAEQFELPVADLTRAEPHVLKLVPEKLALRLGVMPLREDDRRLVVATADPSNPAIEDDLTFVSGRDLQFEIASPAAIADAQAGYRGLTGLGGLQLEDDLTRAVEVLEDSGHEVVDASEVESAPIIKLTNFILSEAVRLRASDIHMEPGRGEGIVRIRVDGVMRNLVQLPMSAINRIVTRAKIMGRMDIADRLRPQDGRARVQVDGRPIELRLSTVPTRETEKCVIRLLDHGTAPTLRDLKLPARDLARIEKLLGHRNGVVIVTGPTGSGKTTTLYAAIRQLATGETNIMTVENPIEYELPGITQIQVEPRQRLTFPSALRAILRQDPDVILIGEIRDLETASIALQASMTGHLVLATLHTNDAASAIERLADLGLERAGIAASLRGVIAQRLVRRLCEKCAVPFEGEPSLEELRLIERFGVRPVRRAVGCQACGKTGYLGRTALLEVLVATPALTALVSGGRGAADVARAAVSGGMTTLLASGLQRVAEGGTTLEEVARVLGGDSEDATDEAHAPRPAIAAARPHVLVVDDDRVQILTARRLLEGAGFQVDEAVDGEAALAKLGNGHGYSLAILDYSMPGLDGLEVLKRLRSRPATRSLPVIVATAQEDEGLEASLMNEGADDYIRKPLVPTRFTARVNAALRRAKSE
jgi:type IV pilus assembly protein PilB